ncbi:MAG: hypothetical protein ABFD58_12445 [Anaerolineaceae bacterium]
MNSSPLFDYQTAHRFFAVDCSTRAWELMSKPNRTPEEDESMVLQTVTSYWHWTQRDDATPTNLSEGLWQLSRVYSLVKNERSAQIFAQKCLDLSEKNDVEPFYIGYAHEAMARAALIRGDHEQAQRHLLLGLQALHNVTDNDDKQLLHSDLYEIQMRLP